LAIFLMAIGTGVKYIIKESNNMNDKEAELLLPLVVALSAFLVIKLVFSQDDNHPMIYMMLGMVAALVYRAHKAEQSPPTLATPSVTKVGAPNLRRRVLVGQARRNRTEPGITR
jgi:hypothetical protein